MNDLEKKVLFFYMLTNRTFLKSVMNYLVSMLLYFSAGLSYLESFACEHISRSDYSMS